MKKYFGLILVASLIILELVCLISYSIISYRLVEPRDIVSEDKKNNNEQISTVNKLSLFMVGDSLIHSAVYADADRGNGNFDFSNMLSEFKDIVSSYDLAFYNQESILGGTELGLSTYPRFNSPYEAGDAYRNIGFNLVSLANNHTLDRGEQAIINSRNYWSNYSNVITAGSSKSLEDRNRSYIGEKNGIKYALLAYTTDTNGLVAPQGKEYLVDVYSDEKVNNDISLLKDKVDIIIVSMHWGSEYSFDVTDEQKQIAQHLSDLGVNIIIGHHPHVVEEIDYVGNTLVVYSLGNFLSAQVGIDRLTGLMVSLDIVKTTENGESSISFSNIKADLTYTYSIKPNGYRTDFKVYPYHKLNNSILPDYEMYYNKYMNIVLKNQLDIERW